MRVIEHFRHSMRPSDGVHLSQAGVDLARSVGATLGPFDRVVTSDQPRALETAVAMGFAVDRQDARLSTMVDLEVDWQDGCAAFATAFNARGATYAAAREQAQLMQAIAMTLPEGGRGLVVSHGGVVELGVVGLLPRLDYSAWTASCGHCEGVRLTFDGASCVSVERLP